MICNCGYKFDESAVGIYGCPNCLGESMSETPEERKARLNRERVARHRAAKNDSGLVKVEVWVKPEHRERLLKYVKRL